MLKFAASALFATLPFLAPAMAREPLPVPTTIEEATAGPSHIAIWKTGDADTTIYLLGTVHILHPDISWETPAFEEAWSAADTVFFEVNITSEDALAEAGALFLKLGFSPDGTKLASYFDKEQKKKINLALAPLQLNLETFAHMRPWFASLQVTQAALAKVGGSPEAGLEMILSSRAETEGKTSRYFETLTQQVSFLSAGSDESQAELFLAGMDELKNLEATFAEMVGAWYRGDAEVLADIIAEGLEEAPEMLDVLLYERNAVWAEALDEVIDTESGVFFVAVGAGHLGGPKSVQEYLEQHGRTVTRVTHSADR